MLAMAWARARASPVDAARDDRWTELRDGKRLVRARRERPAQHLQASTYASAGAGGASCFSAASLAALFVFLAGGERMTGAACPCETRARGDGDGDALAQPGLRIKC